MHTNPQESGFGAQLSCIMSKGAHFDCAFSAGKIHYFHSTPAKAGMISVPALGYHQINLQLPAKIGVGIQQRILFSACDKVEVQLTFAVSVQVRAIGRDVTTKYRGGCGHYDTVAPVGDQQRHSAVTP